MKLTICTPLQYPAINGTSVYAEQLSKKFNARIISTNATDWISFHSPKGKTHNNGSRIKHLESLKNPEILSQARKETTGLMNAIINGPLSNEMLTDLIQDDADIIHSLTLPFMNNYYTLQACRITGKKSAITPFYIKNVVSESHTELLKKYDLVLACTNYEKECIGTPNVKVMPMSVNPLTFEKAKGERFRKKYSIEGPLILFVGHANYEKGAYTILESAKQTNATFAFMGPHTNGFKSRARGMKNVKLINPQLTNKHDAFAACDAYCMPSRVEAFGITYLEAWACKKPVIAADTPVTREVIGENGLIVPFDNNQELTKAIKESLNRKDLGIKGYEKFIKNYTEEKTMNTLRNYYNSLINK